MRLYYYKTATLNFGDDLNEHLWPRLLPGLLTGHYINVAPPPPGTTDRSPLFIGIGTLLNELVPEEPQKIVFGAGFGYGTRPRLDEKWHFYCVRGPLTAQTLGLDPALAITDPAVLVRTLDLPRPDKAYRFAFMPHHSIHAQTGRSGFIAEVCGEIGVAYIDPGWDVDRVLQELLKTEILICEAMHGAIVADALRVPWIAVSMDPSFFPLKWQDWTRSLNIPLKTRRLPVLWKPRTRLNRVSMLFKKLAFQARLQTIMRMAAPTLSRDSEIETATDRLLERLDCFKTEWAATTA